jgi:hypothetical protein
MTGFIGTSLQLKSIITVHNQWLSTTRSSPPPWLWMNEESLPNEKKKSKLCNDRRSIGQSVLVSSTHLGLTTRFLLLPDSCGFVDVGRPLWRENGSSVYNCCWSSPAQSFSGSESPLLSQFRDSLTWRARSPYLYPPWTGWLNYIPRHWVFCWASRVLYYDRWSVGQSVLE